MKAACEESQCTHTVCNPIVLYILLTFSSIFLFPSQAKQLADEKAMVKQIRNLMAIKSSQSANAMKVKINTLKPTTALKMKKLEVLKKQNDDARQDIHKLQQQRAMAKQPSDKAAIKIEPTKLDAYDFIFECF